MIVCGAGTPQETFRQADLSPAVDPGDAVVQSKRIGVLVSKQQCSIVLSCDPDEPVGDI